MLNMAIADDNLNFSKALINSINSTINNIRIIALTTDGEETINILKSYDNIDIILLDLKMPVMSGVDVLEKLQKDNIKKYYNSVIVISGENAPPQKLTENPMVHAFVNKSIELDMIVNSINLLAKEKTSIIFDEKIKGKAIKELLYLGYNLNHKGTQYLIDAICIIADKENIEYMDNNNLIKNIYPIIGKRYKKTAHNIKCCVNLTTTYMFYECDSEKLQKYFLIAKDQKPYTKTIIYTILNKILYSKE